MDDDDGGWFEMSYNTRTFEYSVNYVDNSIKLSNIVQFKKFLYGMEIGIQWNRYYEKKTKRKYEYLICLDKFYILKQICIF